MLGVFGFKDRKCFTSELEDVELNQVLVGGNEFEWSYNGAGDEITIYITYDKIPKTVSEMSDVYSKFLDLNRVRYPEVR